jgi:hypothetical protein
MLLAEFVLDGTMTTTYAPAAQTSDVTYNNKLFDSGPLTQGQHSLVVTPKNEHLVWIDYLLVKQGNAVVPTTSIAPPAQTTLDDLQTQGLPSDGPGSTSLTSASSAKATPIGAIIGVIAALLIAIFAAILALLLLRRRRQRRHRFDNQPEAFVQPKEVPFTIDNSYQSTSNDWLGPRPSIVSLVHLGTETASRPNSEAPSTQISLAVPPSTDIVESQRRIYEKARQEGVAPIFDESSSPSSHRPHPPPTHLDSGLRGAHHASVFGSPPTYTPE